VGQGVVIQCSEDQGHADAVVGAQGGVLGHQPAVAQGRADRVAGEIMGGAAVGLAHHIQVTLQHHARHVLMARAGRLADDQVAGLIHPGCQSAPMGPGLEGVPHGAFGLGRAWNAAQGGEVLPHGGGLEPGEQGVGMGHGDGAQGR
jgi:hypothetical protein